LYKKNKLFRKLFYKGEKLREHEKKKVQLV
jgi:hypothetical protein